MQKLTQLMQSRLLMFYKNGKLLLLFFIHSKIRNFILTFFILFLLEATDDYKFQKKILKLNHVLEKCE